MKQYTDEMYATLLLPAGVTSEASVQFKDKESEDCSRCKAGRIADEVYVEDVLGEKMEINLQELKAFSVAENIKTMIRTVFAMMR